MLQVGEILERTMLAAEAVNRRARREVAENKDDEGDTEQHEHEASDPPDKELRADPDPRIRKDREERHQHNQRGQAGKDLIHEDTSQQVGLQVPIRKRRRICRWAGGWRRTIHTSYPNTWRTTDDKRKCPSRLRAHRVGWRASKRHTWYT